MRLCFVADARSPIARNWIRYFPEAGHEVHVVSTFPCEQDAIPGATIHHLPLAFSWAAGATRARSKREVVLYEGLIRKAISGLHLDVFWYGYIAPLEAIRLASRAKRLMGEIKPDLIHALRTQPEGEVAALAKEQPLLISVWGNDFTLYASRFPLHSRLTRMAMQRADALHCDCDRDLRLARMKWGFDERKPGIVLPSAGGIRKEIFHPGQANPELRRRLGIRDRTRVVFNPRRFDSQRVRNDTFFSAVPLILEEVPDAVFVCVAMLGNPVVQRWLEQLDVGDVVRLLPRVSLHDMAELFRLAEVVVSPSEHDGTPNVLLEAMACGTFPVVGDIESIREWIVDGRNGLLCDPSDPSSLARAVARGLTDDKLRREAVSYNLRLVEERAEYGRIMKRAEEFYAGVIQSASCRRECK